MILILFYITPPAGGDRGGHIKAQLSPPTGDCVLMEQSSARGGHIKAQLSPPGRQCAFFAHFTSQGVSEY